MLSKKIKSMLCENVGRNVLNRMSSGLRGEGKKQDAPKTAMLEAAKLLVITLSWESPCYVLAISSLLTDDTPTWI